METHNGVKGNWEDVTQECAIEWNRSVSSKSSNIRIFHHCNIVGYVGGGTPQQCGDGYRVSATKGVSSLLAGEILVEHFIPDPEYGWVDVTEECALAWANPDGNGAHINVTHNGIGIAWVGYNAEEGGFDERKYRLTATPEDDAGKIAQLGGVIKVEHYQEIE